MRHDCSSVSRQGLEPRSQARERLQEECKPWHDLSLIARNHTGVNPGTLCCCWWRRHAAKQKCHQETGDEAFDMGHTSSHPHRASSTLVRYGHLFPPGVSWRSPTCIIVTLPTVCSTWRKGPGICLTRYRNIRIHHGRRKNAGATPRYEDSLPRGNCLSDGIYQPR